MINCGCPDPDRHRNDCPVPTRAATRMANDAGDVYHAGGPDDAAWLIHHRGARWDPCGCTTPRHAITCPTIAALHPNAMINDAGDVFYPDTPADAAWFRKEHGARYIIDGADCWIA